MSAGKTIFRSKLTDVDTSAKDGVGEIRIEGNKIYKYVKLYNDTATAAVVSGDVLCYAAATGPTTSTVVMDLDDANAADYRIGAGVALATCAGTVDTAFYIWIQVRGPATVAKTLPGSDDGTALTMSNASADGTLVIKNALTEIAVAIGADESAGEILCNFPF